MSEVGIKASTNAPRPCSGGVQASFKKSSENFRKQGVCLRMPLVMAASDSVRATGKWNNINSNFFFNTHYNYRVLTDVQQNFYS